ncbi:MAG TPA: helix-turn-helix transcriptional regulator [Thermoanaerobaculia bacterium]|nr:helix-turn-helix transcriptional regulator [Thermoanaerobaculia bacterium]
MFADLGFDQEEAEHLRVRSDLMIAVRRIIEERSLTQAQAAELFGVTQPRISNLVRGKIDLFSIDTLIDMLARAGVQVEVILSDGQHRGLA